MNLSRKVLVLSVVDTDCKKVRAYMTILLCVKLPESLMPGEVSDLPDLHYVC